MALDYDTDTSKGERAVKVAMPNVISIQPLVPPGDLAWRLCRWKVKAGREVSPRRLCSPAALHLRPHTLQVEYQEEKS